MPLKPRTIVLYLVVVVAAALLLWFDGKDLLHAIAVTFGLAKE
jgi:hypothetical protein